MGNRALPAILLFDYYSLDMYWWWSFMKIKREGGKKNSWKHTFFFPVRNISWQVISSLCTKHICVGKHFVTMLCILNEENTERYSDSEIHKSAISLKGTVVVIIYWIHNYIYIDFNTIILLKIFIALFFNLFEHCICCTFRGCLLEYERLWLESAISYEKYVCVYLVF